MPRDPDAFSPGLVAALRQALDGRADVEERTLFGCLCFMVDGKLCLGVKRDELLVRLPPARHDEFLEQTGVRELSPQGGMRGYFFIEPDGYARRAQWQAWLREALAYNPQARAAPRRGTRKPPPTAQARSKRKPIED